MFYFISFYMKSVYNNVLHLVLNKEDFTMIYEKYNIVLYICKWSNPSSTLLSYIFSNNKLLFRLYCNNYIKSTFQFSIITQYHMRIRWEIHLFGNEPSLVVALEGLEGAIVEAAVPESRLVVLLADWFGEFNYFDEEIAHHGITFEDSTMKIY